jgi:hypothetical protein
MARVVADELLLRAEPGRSSEPVREICIDSPVPCQPVVLRSGEDRELVYLLDGPVAADGYEWYLGAVHSENSLYPAHYGWMAAGDDADPWLAPVSPACPDEPIELSDVTYSAIGRLPLLDCVGDRELALRGWYPAGPPGEVSSQECVKPQDHPFCHFGADLLRPVQAPWAGDANNLGWFGDPAAGLTRPPSDTWIQVIGRFDHPAAVQCGDTPEARMSCRLDFVVSWMTPAPS